MRRKGKRAETGEKVRKVRGGRWEERKRESRPTHPYFSSPPPPVFSSFLTEGASAEERAGVEMRAWIKTS